MSTDDPHPYGSAAHRPDAGGHPPAGRAAMICAAGGSLLTLLAFFAMPLISFGPSRSPAQAPQAPVTHSESSEVTSRHSGCCG